MVNKMTLTNPLGLDMMSVNIFHVSLMVFLVLWVLITLFSFADPPKSLLSKEDFMMRTASGDVTSDDKNKSNQRLSDKGKRKILGWSALFAFIVAIFVHLLHMYVL